MLRKKLPTPTPLIPNARWLKKYHRPSRDYSFLVVGESEVSVNDCLRDLGWAINHILSFDGSKDTMESYRSEVNRFLNWLWLIKNYSLAEVRRSDVVEYLDFSMFPPQSWICQDTPPQFFYGEGDELTPNPAWLPFSKSARARSSVDSMFTRLSSLFECEPILAAIGHNPVQAIRQKSNYRRRIAGKDRPMIITRDQVNYCLDVLEDQCQIAEQIDNRALVAAERSLFVFSMALGLFMRISEFVSTERFTPTHGDFVKIDGCWFLKTVGKGNIERTISVSDDVLAALMRWRDVLRLPPLPSSADRTPMFPRMDAGFWNAESDWFQEVAPVTDTLIVWRLLKAVFTATRERMVSEGKEDEAVELVCASAHWLRHTGITMDIQDGRSIEHVRDDAGHSSAQTTWRYVDATFKDRALSKKGLAMRTISRD